jgi:hypothetical protein
MKEKKSKYLGKTIAEILQHAISHHQGIPLAPVTLVDGFAVSIPLRMLSSLHFL